MKIPGIHSMRNMESTRAASGPDHAEKSSAKKSISSGFRKFGTQVKHGVRDAIKNLNDFSHKLSGKVHDVPRPNMQQATQVASEEIRRQNAAFESRFNPHRKTERPAAQVPHRTSGQHGERPVRASVAPKESAEVEWTRIKFERGQREREVNLLKFDMLRPHPGEMRLDDDVIPHWDKQSQARVAGFRKDISAAEMKLSRYIHGETHIDIKGALREIKAADAGMQSFLKAVQQRERTESARRAEVKHTPAPAENSGPEWDMSKLPKWDKALRREVDQLLKDYNTYADYDDDYSLVEAQRDSAKIQLDAIFSEIENREKTQARLMKNVNANR